MAVRETAPLYLFVMRTDFNRHHRSNLGLSSFGVRNHALLTTVDDDQSFFSILQIYCCGLL